MLTRGFKLFLLVKATGQEKVFNEQGELEVVMVGKLIILEGADCSGKATQTELLVTQLKKEGHDVKTLDFPQYDSFFGKHVAKYLRGEYGTLDTLHPELASMLFAFDRFGQKEKLKKWLDSGAVIILNRYMESNMGHQGAKISNREELQSFLEWLEELELKRLGIPKADVVLYLHVPTEISQQIIQNREDKGYLNGEKQDIHEKDGEYQKRCVQTYVELCERFPHWHKIACISEDRLLSREAIHELIWEIVRQEL